MPAIQAAILLHLHAAPGHGATLSDAAREQRRADQIVDRLIDAEAVWLEAAGHRFLSVHPPAYPGPAKGALLPVHGTGAPPDRPQVIQPLRSGLAKRGWQSLSIQRPLPPEGSDTPAAQLALLDEGAARIQTALAWLENQGSGDMTIASHSRGGADVLFLAATRHDHNVASPMVSVNDTCKNLPAVNALLKVKQPYRIYDFEGVIDSAPARREAAISAANPDYRQAMIPDADHPFEGHEDRDTPPAKAGGFGLRLKAGLIGHSAD